MILLKEFEQIIHVKRDAELKEYQIRYALLDAQRTARYAKFYCGRYYITITFNRDHTIQFSSNYRGDTRFDRELGRLESYKFTINTTAHFIWYWMNKFRKM